MRITPLAHDDFHLLTLTIPLIYKSLQISLCKVLNLPALYPELKLHFTCGLEGQYIAVLKHDMSAVLTIEQNIHACMAPQGYLYMIHQALCPVNEMNGAYGLFSFNTINA